MSSAAVASAIRVKFRDDVATPNSLSVLHDNAAPTGIEQDWYRLAYTEDSTKQITTGGEGQRRYRIMGRAELMMFTPKGKGDGHLLELADQVIEAFRGKSLSSPMVRFFEPPSLVGSLDEATEGYVQRYMQIPFEADVFG